PVKSISTGPSGGFNLSARRLDASDPARNATFDPVKLSAVSGTSARTSSSSAPNMAAFSAAAEISSMCGAGLPCSSSSRNSLASRLSPPTRATRERAAFSANLMLRFMRRLRLRTQTPPHGTADANRDADSYVADGQHQQYGLGKIPNQEN